MVGGGAQQLVRWLMPSSFVCLKHAQITGPGGVWEMMRTARKVHASASTHVLQFLARGRGWGGHL